MSRGTKVSTSETADLVVISEDNKTTPSLKGSGSKLLSGKKAHGKKLRKMRMTLPRFLMPELKRAFSAAFWDAETLDDPGTGASAYNFLSQIEQGANPTQRVGDVIFVDEIVLRLYMEQSSSTTFSTAEFRLIEDREPAAGAPGWNTVFNGIGGASVQSYHVAIPDFDQRWRFKYLKEGSFPQAWTASSVNGGVTTSAIRPVSMTWRIPVKREIMYNSTSAYPVRGGEFILFGWSSLSANTPKVWASYEIFFTDS